MGRVTSAHFEAWLDELLATPPNPDALHQGDAAGWRFGPTEPDELRPWSTPTWDGYQAAKRLGVRFTAGVSNMNACGGITTLEHATGKLFVWLNPLVDVTQRPRVLMHELGHCVLNPRSYHATRSAAEYEHHYRCNELEAEAVAVLVSRAAGCYNAAGPAYFNHYRHLNGTTLEAPPPAIRRRIVDAALRIYEAGAVAPALKQAA